MAFKRTFPCRVEPADRGLISNREKGEKTWSISRDETTYLHSLDDIVTLVGNVEIVSVLKDFRHTLEKAKGLIEDDGNGNLG